MNNNSNYKKLGFKCGLEIHYQLDTKRKLFCNCPVGLRNDPHDAEIIRHMRPTLSELGEYDGTALMEFKTKKEIHYQLHYDSVCTYEMDDTPPFLLNKEALHIALEIALLLNCQIADEIHVSRKQYLDGSIPTGFQRTIAVGVNGWIPFRNRKIRIMQLCLEEDACREISDEGHIIILRTDRLSTPLVEVITCPDMVTPEEAVEVDREIGRILRSTGKVRRGIGTVRQDVNVSIKGGTRIEIKGVPKTGLIKNLVHNEAMRQNALLLLKQELNIRGINSDTIRTDTTICRDFFKNTKVKSIAEAIKNGGAVGAVKLCGFAGLMNYEVAAGRTFADELKGRVRVIACLDKVPILFHSDTVVEGFSHSEYPSEKEWQKVKKALSANHTDSIVIVWGNKQDVNTALSEISIRIKEATTGVPNETRQALKGGVTDFERILPGPDRMYPDTDSAPIPINDTLIEEIKKKLPHTPEYWRKKYKNLLHSTLIDQLFDKGYIELFDEVYRKTGSNMNLIATTLVSTITAVKRRNTGAEKIKGIQLIELFEAFEKGSIPREAIYDILTEMARSNKPLASLIMETVPAIHNEGIKKAVRQVMTEYASLPANNPEKKMKFLIGQVKRKLGKYTSGKKIFMVLQEYSKG